MSSTTASRLTGNPTSGDLDTLAAYIDKMSVTQKSSLRSSIGNIPEQQLATWSSQLVGDYTSTLNVDIAKTLPSQPNVNRQAIAFCENQNAIIVVPSAGSLLYFGTPNSNGGVDWTTKTSPITLSANVEVVASETTFVIYRYNDSEMYATSNQGASFTTVTFPDPAADIRKISYGNGLFVAVGALNDYYTSTNGVTWVDRGSFAVGGPYGTIGALEYVPSLSEWVLVTVSNPYITFYKTNPASGGNWSTVINSTNSKYQFTRIYECEYGCGLVSNGYVLIYEGSGATLVEDNTNNTVALTDLFRASFVAGGGLNVFEDSGSLVYSKTGGDHTLSRASAPSIDSVGSGCYAGGGFNQFIFTSTNGKIYYSLRG